MTRKFVISILLIAAFGVFLWICSSSTAEDWSQYVSGRNNIRLDGYDGQVGYIAFTDGAGTVQGYLWAEGGQLMYITRGSVDLTAARLGEGVNLPFKSHIDMTND